MRKVAAMCLRSRRSLPLLLAAVMAGLTSGAGSVFARDRPGTPTNVKAYQCWGYHDQPRQHEGKPSVCVTFYNTARERVVFDVEWTVNGIQHPTSELKDLIGCMFPRSGPEGCAAGMYIGGARQISTQVGKTQPGGWAFGLMLVPLAGGPLQAMYLADPKGFDKQYGQAEGGERPEQGFFLKNLDFDTDYCFRFKARDADSGVLSEIWSNDACTRTSSPPPKPRSDIPRATYHPSQWDGSSKSKPRPNRVVIEPRVNGPVAYVTFDVREYGKDHSSTLEGVFGDSTHKRGGGPETFEIPPQWVKDGPPVYIVKVCAHNFSGSSCAETSTAPLPTAETERPVDSRVVDAPRTGDKVARLPGAESGAKNKIVIHPSGTADRRLGDKEMAKTFTPRVDSSSGAGSAPRSCKSGFVWREARAEDVVCVPPESRARVAKENRTAASQVEPGGGPYGPDTCRSGLVWREAFPGDRVCVPPHVRDVVREENRLGPSRHL
jgi:hypothetical protein